jgi:hypothetical protein
MKTVHRRLLTTVALCLLSSNSAGAEDLLTVDNGVVRVGIDRSKGAAITWLSWKTYPKNMVNSADPGRLIQQSYYAGQSLDRTADGQSEAWSPWTWNPIQGGGVSSWARVREFKRIEGRILYAETVPKLWDMPDEEAAAVMRQWTSLDPQRTNVVSVECELICNRRQGDRWGPAVLRHQEIPACYFTRNFEHVRSYLGEGNWRDESQPPGPPWGTARPPLRAMACFESGGQGVAVFSPSSALHWNFGPHRRGVSDDPKAGPCMHVAPLDRVALGPKSTYRYRYWLVVGDETSISSRLDALWKAFSEDRAELGTQHALPAGRRPPAGSLEN